MLLPAGQGVRRATPPLVWIAIAAGLTVSSARAQDTVTVCIGDSVAVGGRAVGPLSRDALGTYSLVLVNPQTAGLPLRLAVLVVRDCGRDPSTSPASPGATAPIKEPAIPAPSPDSRSAQEYGPGEPTPSTGDSILFRETFDHYARREAMIRAGGGSWDVGGTSTSVTEPGGGRNGGRALTMHKPPGLSGPVAQRRIRSALPQLFVSFWFRLETVGANPRPEAKWVILHHDAEGKPGCLGRPVARYQFALTTELAFGGRPRPSRFGARGVQDSECPGPVVGDNQRGFFSWSVNPQEPAPVLASDPGIQAAPWGPINDGAWHRWTMELKAGDGSYVKLWLDGHLYWNSMGQRMRMPGRPTSFKLEMVSGTRSTEFTAWFDDITIWARP